MARRRRSGTPQPRTASAPLILIVDDNQEARDLYATYFLWQGFRVQTASDGEMAVARAVEFSPDVVVMDLAMPRVDGWEATRRLKHDSRTAHIPVVACTGHAFGGSVARGFIVGCDAYVVKPCLPEDLMRQVREVLSRPSVARRRA